MNFAIQCRIQPNTGGGGCFQNRPPKLVSAATIVKPITVSTWRRSPNSYINYKIPTLPLSSSILGGGGGDDGRGNWKIFSGGGGYSEDGSNNQGPIKGLRSLAWTIILSQVPFFYISFLNKVTEFGIHWVEAENEKLCNGGYRPSEEKKPKGGIGNHGSLRERR